MNFILSKQEEYLQEYYLVDKIIKININ